MRRNLTGTGGSNVTYPAQEARDENQLQPQRNIDGAQGGTVDCAETTELTCDSTDSAQGGTVDCAATTELTCSGTDSAQRGIAVTQAEAGPTSLAPRNKRKRKKARSPGCMSKHARRREAFEQRMTK